MIKPGKGLADTHGENKAWSIKEVWLERHVRARARGGS